MFDVLNRVTIDAAIRPKAVGEREMAASHMLKLMPTDLLLLDRGYPAFWLFKLVVSLGANFCARVSCTIPFDAEEETDEAALDQLLKGRHPEDLAWEQERRGQMLEGLADLTEMPPEDARTAQSSR